MISIGIADSHSIVRHGIRSWLETEHDFSIVGETGKGEEALQIVVERSPAVLILDLNMPDIDGIQMIRRVRSYSPQTRILILTAYSTQWAVSAIDAGASGYLLKDEERATLVAAVRWAAEHSDGTWLSPGISKSILSLQANVLKAELTYMETEVIKLLKHSNKAIACQLCIGEGTVRNHVSSIYSKLNIHSRYEAIEWARGHGYL